MIGYSILVEWEIRGEMEWSEQDRGLHNFERMYRLFVERSVRETTSWTLYNKLFCDSCTFMHVKVLGECRTIHYFSWGYSFVLAVAVCKYVDLRGKGVFSLL